MVSRRGHQDPRGGRRNLPGLGKTAGISPTSAFCSIVEFVSNTLLTLIADAPWLVAAIAFAGAASVFFTVRNTNFGLGRDPLRRRRRFGQILRTAGSIYRTNTLLMLGIALAFIPAGLRASGLQSLIFNNPPVGPILDAVQLSRLSRIILGASLGSATFGIAYLFVTSAVVSAVREIEAGRPVSPLKAYQVLWHQLWDLFRARPRAVATVFLLVISIVGIPYAIRRTIDWLFIEQAMLLDGAPRGDAAGQSRAAVKNDWWRALAITVLLTAIGAVTSLVVVTPIILFATAVPLDFVNTLGSLIYIIVTPFVALAFTLLYFDVKAHGDDVAAAPTHGR